MTDSFTPVARALVAATLVIATATVMLVTVSRGHAAGAVGIQVESGYASLALARNNAFGLMRQGRAQNVAPDLR